MPHPESRRLITGLLDSNGAVALLATNGDSNVSIYLDTGGATFTGTYVTEYTPDSVNWFALPSYPYPPGCIGGTVPQAAQPMLTEAVSAANVKRLLLAACGQIRGVRVRLTAWTAGSMTAALISDVADNLNPFVRDSKASTLSVTATATIGAAVTASLPAVAGLRHYIRRISVTRNAAGVLTVGTTPVLVTTTNIPGLPIMSFGADASTQGTDREIVLDYGSDGIAASAIGTATTIVAPVASSVIWRINVDYRLGL